MMDRRHWTVTWIGFLLAASLAVPGSAVAMTGSEHCDETAAAAASHEASHPMPPAGACLPSGPCSKCGALPCSAIMSCVPVSILTPTEPGVLPAPAPANAAGMLRYSMLIPARSIIPPTPPPIPLL